MKADKKSPRELLLLVFGKILEGIETGELDARVMLDGLEKLLARKKSPRQNKKTRLLERYRGHGWGRVLAYLVSHPKQLLSHEDIFRSVWQQEPDAQSAYKRIIWESIFAIRKHRDLDSLGLIETVSKRGYIFRP